jgi:Do/DeqQ family serine protease
MRLALPLALPLPVALGAALALAALSAAPPAAADAAAASSEARHLSDAFSAVADRVSASVVQIEVAVREQNGAARWYRGAPGGESAVQRGMGSGVVLSADGAILTNNHVVEDALSISVRLRDGRILPARLVGRDPATDLAVVKVEVAGLLPARFADSDRARVGEWVVAIGSPFGLGYTVTTGVVSAKGRGGMGVNAVEDYLQTDASINPGNSGGPLVSLDGLVLGINTMIVGKGQGIGFAVPSNLARRTAEQILRTGRVQRAWIGVGIQDVGPEIAAELRIDPNAGALVNNVSPGGPGARAQLAAGDVIATVDGKRVHDAQDLIRELLAHDVGQSVALEVIRGARRYATRVDLAARPEPVPAETAAQIEPRRQQGLGLSMRDLTPEMAVSAGLSPRATAQVVGVVPGSAADRAGLRPGDAVIEADGQAEPSTAQIAAAASDGHMLLRVRRRDAVFYAALRR